MKRKGKREKQLHKKPCILSHFVLWFILESMIVCKCHIQCQLSFTSCMFNFKFILLIKKRVVLWTLLHACRWSTIPLLLAFLIKTSKDLCIHDPLTKVTFSSVHHIYLHRNNVISSIFLMLHLIYIPNLLAFVCAWHGEASCGVNPQT